MLVNLSYGQMSAAVCEDIAKAAVKDIEASKNGYALPKLEAFANRSSGHAMRHVMTAMKGECSLPDPFRVEIPYKGGNHAGDILLPHEMFAAVHSKCPNAWSK